MTAVGWALTCGAAAAQSPGNVTIDASRCANIQAAEERLACYEAEIGKARAESAEPAASATSPASPTSPASVPKDAAAASVGNASSAANAASAGAAEVAASVEPAPRGRSARAEEPEPPPEIHATITALRERRPGEHFITLDNGQVWRQRGWEAYPLRVGAKVRIYASRWGSERLSIEGIAGFIQVEQVE